jgi:cysteine desulfurase
MMSEVKHIGPSACNKLIKDKLEAKRIIVSVGSACNTKSNNHSHVLRAMNIPDVVMDGAIRVSMCAFTTVEEIDRFVDVFVFEVNRQYQTAKK